MMNRLNQLFEKKKNNVLNIYVTAGYPHLDDTLPMVEALEKYGADIVELGVPYSDPLADGPVIQHSGSIALHNGMSMAKLFEQLKPMRQSVSIPVVLMGYLNPVLQYGIERFCDDAERTGVDGIILPDLPALEYERDYRQLFQAHNLHFIFLITPETSEERIRQLDDLSSGFLYAVSSSSTTGGQQDFEAVGNYLQRLKSMNLKNPILVGFGIKDRQSFNAVSKQVHGGIIGSAFIRHLEGKDNVEEAVKEFLAEIR